MRGYTKHFYSLRNGFTLVELIISITILSILSVLAFINVRIYISDSKNTKIVNDLNSLSNSLRAYTTAGQNILGFVANTGSRIPNISLFGSTGSLSIEEYNAGDINYSAFGTSKEKFIDPYLNKSYKIGILQTPGRNSFELAGTYRELDGGTLRTKLYGSYTSRKSTKQVNISQIIPAANYVELYPKDTGFFKVGDLISNGVQTYRVQEISKNLQSIYLDTVFGLTLSSSLSLQMSETKGLIGSSLNLSNPVYEGSSELAY